LKCAQSTQPIAAILFENLQNIGSFKHEENVTFYHLLNSDFNIKNIVKRMYMLKMTSFYVTDGVINYANYK